MLARCSDCNMYTKDCWDWQPSTYQVNVQKNCNILHCTASVYSQSMPVSNGHRLKPSKRHRQIFPFIRVHPKENPHWNLMEKSSFPPPLGHGSSDSPTVDANPCPLLTGMDWRWSRGNWTSRRWAVVENWLLNSTQLNSTESGVFHQFWTFSLFVRFSWVELSWVVKVITSPDPTQLNWMKRTSVVTQLQ
jgi:hypothetical protein